MQKDFCLGFTGTQEGMNERQLEIFTEFARGIFKYAVDNGFRPVFRHGDCVGSDDQAARTCKLIGFWVIAHPCTIKGKRAYCPASDWGYAEKPPLERNHDIVDASNYMTATPKETEEEVKRGGEPIRSGTWATIRYTRKKQKPHFIIHA